MHVAVGGTGSPLEPDTELLLHRMLCPLSGLAQSIGFAKRAPLDPRIAVAGGEMTGVHILRGLPPPPPGSYHIGGSGTTYQDAVIRTLGETLERYAQFAALAAGMHPTSTASLGEMRARGDRVLAPYDLRFFTDEQLARSGFPFEAVGEHSPIGWISARSLIDGSPTWAPAQQTLVGYSRGADEPRFMVGVTTGSAAHTDLGLALRNAALELVQLDAAVGHWYGQAQTVRIEPGQRTRNVERAIRARLHPDGPVPRFYWLPSPDLPGLAIACVVEGTDVPHFAVGLGCDLGLARAMYKAFLEGVAVAQLAKIILFRREAEGQPRAALDLDPGALYDLDSNVGYYAARAHGEVRERFADAVACAPSELPPDQARNTAADLRLLIDGFSKTGNELIGLDLTTADVRDLGFRVVRLWSPDLLSLPLPSAPPLLHPRFTAYGGGTDGAPHPFP